MDRKQYILQAMQDQQVAGIPPMMQNTGAQQANQDAVMQQANQITAQSGQQPQGSGMNLMALASALKKDKKKEEELANKEMALWNQRPALEFYSKGMNPMDIISDQ